MKIAVIGYAGAGTIVARHLIDARIDIGTVDIVEARTIAEAIDADLVLKEQTMLEEIAMTFEKVPVPIDFPEISPKRDFQPRFQFKNIRKIRK